MVDPHVEGDDRGGGLAEKDKRHSRMAGGDEEFSGEGVSRIVGGVLSRAAEILSTSDLSGAELTATTEEDKRIVIADHRDISRQLKVPTMDSLNTTSFDQGLHAAYDFKESRVLHFEDRKFSDSVEINRAISTMVGPSVIEQHFGTWEKT